MHDRIFSVAPIGYRWIGGIAPYVDSSFPVTHCDTEWPRFVLSLDLSSPSGSQCPDHLTLLHLALPFMQSNVEGKTIVKGSLLLGASTLAARFVGVAVGGAAGLDQGQG